MMWIADPETMAANAIEDMVNGYDRGDLLVDIDRAIGDVIERALHRYLPRDRAKELRRETVERLGNEVTDHAK